MRIPKQASKIADMRAAGLPAPVDHLTSEAIKYFIDASLEQPARMEL